MLVLDVNVLRFQRFEQTAGVLKTGFAAIPEAHSKDRLGHAIEFNLGSRLRAFGQIAKQISLINGFSIC